jgi:hypothetical protein
VIGDLVARVRKNRWDPQPTQQAAVLLASAGDPLPRSMVLQGVKAADGADVAVVTVARIYGSAWGLPNPGLMPTRREMETQRGLVEAALGIVTAKGANGWGQVVTSRNPARSIARVAQARGSERVLVVVPDAPRWRHLVEGDLVRAIQRRVGPAVVVEGVPAAGRGRQLHPQRS